MDTQFKKLCQSCFKAEKFGYLPGSDDYDPNLCSSCNVKLYLRGNDDDDDDSEIEINLDNIHSHTPEDINQQNESRINESNDVDRDHERNQCSKLLSTDSIQPSTNSRVKSDEFFHETKQHLSEYGLSDNVSENQIHQNDMNINLCPDVNALQTLLDATAIVDNFFDSTQLHNDVVKKVGNPKYDTTVVQYPSNPNLSQASVEEIRAIRFDALPDSALSKKANLVDISDSSNFNETFSKDDRIVFGGNTDPSRLSVKIDIDVIKDILHGNNDIEVLFKCKATEMTREILKRLKPGIWLNDIIINFYMDMLEDYDTMLCNIQPTRLKSHYFSSFFMSKLYENGECSYDAIRRWSKNFDICSIHMIFIPINIKNSHWTLGVIDMVKKEIHYYDSMHGEGSTYLNIMMLYLSHEFESRKGIGKFNIDEWKLISKSNVPKQTNGYDCGVFTILAAEFLTQGLSINENSYRQDTIEYHRERMLMEIVLHGKSNGASGNGYKHLVTSASSSAAAGSDMLVKVETNSNPKDPGIVNLNDDYNVDQGQGINDFGNEETVKCGIDNCLIPLGLKNRSTCGYCYCDIHMYCGIPFKEGSGVSRVCLQCQLKGHKTLIALIDVNDTASGFTNDEDDSNVMTTNDKKLCKQICSIISQGHGGVGHSGVGVSQKKDKIEGSLDGELSSASCIKLANAAGIMNTDTILDLGCSGGTTLFRLVYLTKCAAGVGIEEKDTIWQMANIHNMNIMKNLHGYNIPTHFYYGNITTDFISFNGYSVIYMFDAIFVDELMIRIAEIMKKSTGIRLLISSKKLDVLKGFGFNVKLVKEIGGLSCMGGHICREFSIYEPIKIFDEALDLESTTNQHHIAIAKHGQLRFDTASNIAINFWSNKSKISTRERNVTNTSQSRKLYELLQNQKVSTNPNITKYYTGLVPETSKLYILYLDKDDTRRKLNYTTLEYNAITCIATGKALIVPSFDGDNQILCSIISSRQRFSAIIYNTETKTIYRKSAASMFDSFDFELELPLSYLDVIRPLYLNQYFPVVENQKFLTIDPNLSNKRISDGSKERVSPLNVILTRNHNKKKKLNPINEKKQKENQKQINLPSNKLGNKARKIDNKSISETGNKRSRQDDDSIGQTDTSTKNSKKRQNNKSYDYDNSLMSLDNSSESPPLKSPLFTPTPSIVSTLTGQSADNDLEVKAKVAETEASIYKDLLKQRELDKKEEFQRIESRRDENEKSLRDQIQMLKDQRARDDSMRAQFDALATAKAETESKLRKEYEDKVEQLRSTQVTKEQMKSEDEKVKLQAYQQKIDSTQTKLEQVSNTLVTTLQSQVIESSARETAMRTESSARETAMRNDNATQTSKIFKNVNILSHVITGSNASAEVIRELTSSASAEVIKVVNDNNST